MSELGQGFEVAGRSSAAPPIAAASLHHSETGEKCQEIYADRILKGANPSELPVQAPVKLVLVINLKTAKELQLEVPLSLLPTSRTTS